MPTFNNHYIEKITVEQAEKKGYLTRDEGNTHRLWVNAKYEERKNKRFIYIDGVYCGMAEKNEPIHKICDRFKLHAA